MKDDDRKYKVTRRDNLPGGIVELLATKPALPFDPNDKATIDAALQSGDDTNPIRQTLQERLDIFEYAFLDTANPGSRAPLEIVLDGPTTYFDEVAIRLAAQSFADKWRCPVHVRYED